MAIFHPHGEFHVELKNNVLQVELIGEWNKETADLFVNKCKHEINNIPGQDWGLLVLMDKFILAVPEAINKGKEFVLWAFEHGCVADALVYQHNALKSELVSQLTPEIKTKAKNQHFLEQNQALQWLQQQGFSTH